MAMQRKQIRRAVGYATCGIISMCACAVWTRAQETAPQPALTHRPAAESNASPAQTISLTVPANTPIHVALDKEVRIQKVGQVITGHVVDPVYAFDRLVIPVGTEATGRITKLQGPSNKSRTLSALNADFTPARKIEITFDGLVLPGGKDIAIHTNVAPGSGQVIQFVSAADAAGQKKGLADEATKRTKEAKAQARQQWNDAMKQVKAPGKIHRLERYAIAQSPIHPQYIDAGTIYIAELQEPVDFGTEPLTPELTASLSAAPPDGSVVHAELMTALSSATTQKGAAVEAVISQPLFDDKKLIVPEGSILSGSVIQVQPARRLSRNGQLRMVFHELRLPDGVEQKVEASVAGVQAGKADNVKLDSEGGAQATTPKTRYLTTGISIGMAAISGRGDEDAKAGPAAGNASNRAIGGLGGFKLVGAVLGGVVQSRAFGYSMGAYGAGVSVYTHFVARGHDVVFAKNTAMEIGIGTRQPSSSSAAPSAPVNQ
jgi:hypothetical protein